MSREKSVKKKDWSNFIGYRFTKHSKIRVCRLQNVHHTQNGSTFLVFDSRESSEKAFNEISESNFKVKYSYYKVFFRLNDCDLNTLDYDTTKNSIISSLTSLNSNIDVLYFKFYTKNNKLIGSGDLTLDTKEDLDSLVSLRELDVTLNGELKKVSVYRFRMKRRPLHQNTV